MTNNYSKDPKQAMAQFVASLPDDKKRAIMSSHLATLRSYAKRVLLEKDFLSPDEESDKELRLIPNPPTDRDGRREDSGRG